MKKIILLLTVLLTLSLSAFADFGVGAEAGFDANLFYKPYFRSLANVSIRSDELPWCLSATVWPSDLNFTVYADNWFVNEKLDTNLSYYVFWGVSALAGFDNFKLATGPRIGGGIDWFLLDHRNLELYWQVAWNPYLGIENDDGVGFLFRPASIPFQTGARWWFR